MRCGSSASLNATPPGPTTRIVAQLEQRAGIDADRDRGGGAVAVGFGGAREGGDVARADAQACSADRNGDGGIVVARAPQRVEDRREVTLGAPRQRLSVGRRVLAQPVERGGIRDRVLEPAVAAGDVDRYRIGDRRRRDGRGRLVRPPEAEEIEGLSGAEAAKSDHAGR